MAYARPSPRTSEQRDADALDLQVFRCIGALLQFADDHKDKDVREMGIALGQMRQRVRKHMHPVDQKETA
ncbi:hypothetical protein FJ959_22170 [Mesorhizobium sp. B2-2-4]|uniref:hypothetical protein n=1 Tax=unclassified Mesorhizobium TaxID=325217 RepID=UPI00112753BF|nr:MULTISPECIES: hypothetical protein [unclassified Mesorhizobium]TPM53240.1 hypothetical protein FJ959_22170 [Mesorhizobium sp. B2-2-4]TPM62118.1 hypothetical protein FJ965_21200 [Mesorhizobium sp. B2-2-1]TPN68489.1 hypothetical protein FJ984_11680 [Mesorhizobium sp. B1-1-3]